MSAEWTATRRRVLREQSEERWLNLGGMLGEAKGSAELMHERGLLSDELFWEAIGALDGMMTLVNDIVQHIAADTG